MRSRRKPLIGPNVAIQQIRDARVMPYDFIAIGQDDAAHLAIEAAAIVRCDDYNAKAVSAMLKSAALAIGRSNRHARFCNRRLTLVAKKKRAS